MRFVFPILWGGSSNERYLSTSHANFLTIGMDAAFRRCYILQGTKEFVHSNVFPASDLEQSCERILRSPAHRVVHDESPNLFALDLVPFKQSLDLNFISRQNSSSPSQSFRDLLDLLVGEVFESLSKLFPSSKSAMCIVTHM